MSVRDTSRGNATPALEQVRTAFPHGLYGASADKVVLAQLREGNLDGAWVDARDKGCTWSTWLDLADASRAYDPDAAASVYVSAAEHELEHPGAPRTSVPSTDSAGRATRSPPRVVTPSWR